MPDAPEQGQNAGHIVRGREVAPQPLYPPARLLKGNVQDAARTIREAGQRVQVAEAQATAILEQAHADAKSIRERARQEGIEEGAAALRTAARALSSSIDKLLDEQLPKQVRAMAFSIARQILNVEFQSNANAVLQLVRTLLDRVKTYTQVSIVLHPEYVASVRQHEGQLLERLVSAEAIQIREDASLSRTGCRVETEMGTFDGSLDVQMARLWAHAMTTKPVAPQIDDTTEDVRV